MVFFNLVFSWVKIFFKGLILIKLFCLKEFSCLLICKVVFSVFWGNIGLFKVFLIVLLILIVLEFWWFFKLGLFFLFLGLGFKIKRKCLIFLCKLLRFFKWLVLRFLLIVFFKSLLFRFINWLFNFMLLVWVFVILLILIVVKVFIK